MKVEEPPARGRDVLERGTNSGMRVAVLSGLLFFSGIGALIFETLWLRLSGLAFGNSVWAAALILSSFMAGLALGNAIAASSKIGRWRPLHLYAVLEILVALLGCTIVFGLPLLGAWLRPVWQMLWNFQPTLLALRFVLSFLILLIPTTAMGLTLPVLIEDPLLRRSDFGRAIGFLYGSNTLGAVAGAVLGEAYLIAAFGLRGTSVAAGLASCLAATIALLVAKNDGAVAELVRERAFPLRLTANYRPPWRLLLVSFGTGCTFLCLEVIWFRFLRLYVASYSLAFAIMLAVVLLGIGSGGLMSGLIYRRATQRNQFLAILLLLSAIVVPVSYLLFPGEVVRAPTEFFNIGAWPQIVLLCLALMFPAAFLSGILFPTIIARVQASVEDRMNSTGITTLFNTTGAAVGPLLASFVLLPSIGFQWGLLLCSAGYAFLAVLASERSDWSMKRLPGLSMVALGAALIFIFVMFPYQRAEKHFHHAAVPYEADSEGSFRTQAVKRLEGSADTWQLLRQDLFGQPYRYRLLSNAISMSGTSAASQRYMRLFAYLPLAFRPESEEVLLLCFGCGVTADAFLHGPRVRRMDVVDISKEVFELADFYSGINYSNPLRDSRVHPIVQDGRFFLQASPRQYDIISGEPPPPKIAGAVNLYTQDFFALMNNRLKPGGIATFWLPLDQLTVNDAKVILRAFHNAFPNSSVWASADQEWIMMGINGSGHRLEEAEIRQLWSDPASGADLARIGVEVPEQLAALFLMDGGEIERITHDTKPLTDFYPKRLTDITVTDKFIHDFAATYMQASAAAQRFRSSPLIQQIWPDVLEKSLDPFFVIREMRYHVSIGELNWLAELDLHLRGSRLQEPVLEALHTSSLRVALAEKTAHGLSSSPPELLSDLIAAALARRDFQMAIQLLEEKRASSTATREDVCLLTYLYCLNGNVDKAESIAPETMEPNGPFVQWLWAKLQAEYGFRPPHRS
jgi:spermidine synthase